MSHKVHCIKLDKEAEGLNAVTYPGELGKRIYEQVSQEAWQMWLSHQTMLINEYRLTPIEPKSREFLEEEMEKFFFGGGSEKPKDLTIERNVNSINPLSWIKVGLKLKKQSPDILILKYWIPFLAPCLGTISRIVRKNNHTKVIVVLDNLIPHEKRIGDNFLNKYFINILNLYNL